MSCTAFPTLGISGRQSAVAWRRIATHRAGPATVATLRYRGFWVPESTDLACDIRGFFQVPFSVDLRCVGLAMAQKNLRGLEPEP
jgi:hypothetical protein